jgi:cytoskeletal protein CcmA (bactofilin family)
VFTKKRESGATVPVATYSVLDAQCVVHGSVRTDGTLRIDGRLEGDVTRATAVVLGVGAVIRGNVTAGDLVVGGTIEGNVTADSRVELEATAVITGDIRAHAILVHEGATITGRMLVGPTPAASADGAARDPRLSLASGSR